MDGRKVIDRVDADGLRRELFQPLWWPLYQLWLRVLFTFGVTIDLSEVERLHLKHSRWRVTPPDL